jgi:hypothetical protein
MGFWSNKTKKSVEFTDEVADHTLLAVVKKELQKQPHKRFSDLCKEALWQYLYVPESVRPSRNSASADNAEAEIAELKGQLASIEQRIAAQEANRLDALESQVQQLSLQVGQLAIALNEGRASYQPPPQPHAQPQPQPEPEPEPEPVGPPKPVDPLLQRLSSFIDDF